MSTSLNIQYSDKQKRLRLRFPASLCLSKQSPPEVIFKKVRAQYNELKEKGDIDFYEIAEKSFSNLWNNIRSRIEAGEPSDLEVVFTAACGARNLKGLSFLVEEKEGKIKLYVSASSEEDWANVPFDMLRLNVLKLAAQKGVKKPFNQSQLYSLWIELKNKGGVQNFPVSLEPKFRETPDGFYLSVNRARKEVSVVILDDQLCADSERIARFFKSLQYRIKKLNREPGCAFRFLEHSITERLKAAMRGPERWGLYFPLVYLVAVHDDELLHQAEAELQSIVQNTVGPVEEVSAISREAEEDAVAKAVEGETPEIDEDTEPPEDLSHLEPYPGKGKLQILASDDNMEAQVGLFEDSWYEGAEFEVNIDWFKKEIKNKGIIRGIDPQAISDIGKSIKEKENFTEKVFASGQLPVTASNPEISKASIGGDEEVSDEEDVDLRERQQNIIVEKGDLVATVVYKDAGEDGFDIYGKVLEFEWEPFDIELGEGVFEGKEKGTYYAEFNGVPNFDGKVLSLSKVLEIKENVNFNTGNIRFDGTVEVKGSIEPGTVVECTEKLIVHGSVEGGDIWVGGDMEVKGGIVTGSESSKIRVKGDLLANFIENSKVIVDGNLKIHKTVLNSDVFVGGKINIKPEGGSIGGGKIYCGGLLKTGFLGFESGKESDIKVGVNWRYLLSHEIAVARLEYFETTRATLKGDLRELVRSKASLKAKERKEKMEIVQEKILRLKEIIAYLTEKVTSTKDLIKPDKDARIYVHQTAHMNCKIEVGGVKVYINQAIAGIEITPKKYKESNIIPLSGSTPNAKKNDDKSAA